MSFINQTNSKKLHAKCNHPTGEIIQTSLYGSVKSFVYSCVITWIISSDCTWESKRQNFQSWQHFKEFIRNSTFNNVRMVLKCLANLTNSSYSWSVGHCHFFPCQNLLRHAVIINHYFFWRTFSLRNTGKKYAILKIAFNTWY